jgi:hypothetical protein
VSVAGRRGMEGEEVAFLPLDVKTDGGRPLFHIVEDTRHVLFAPHHVDIIHVRGEKGRRVLPLQPHEDGLKGGAEKERTQGVTLANTGSTDAQDGAVCGVDGGGPTVAPTEKPLKAGRAVIEAVEDRPTAYRVKSVGKIHLLDSEARVA